MTGSSQRLQTMYAGSGFLTAAHQLSNQVTTLAVQHVYEVAAVVDNQLRLNLQCFAQIHIVFLVRAAMSCKNGYAAVNQSCSDFVLRRQRIAAGNNNVCTSIFQHECQIGSFCFQMDGNNHVNASERFSFAVLLVQVVQQGHIFLCPCNTLVTKRC